MTRFSDYATPYEVEEEDCAERALLIRIKWSITTRKQQQ
jgi:hypothetical protein